jgi:hypothetical protein
MSELGISPRLMAMVALVLAIFGAVGILTGVFSSAEWILVGLLAIVAALSFRRAQGAGGGKD